MHSLPFTSDDSHDRVVFTHDTSESVARIRVPEGGHAAVKVFTVSADDLDDLRLIRAGRLEEGEISWEELKQQLGL